MVTGAQRLRSGGQSASVAQHNCGSAVSFSSLASTPSLVSAPAGASLPAAPSSSPSSPSTPSTPSPANVPKSGSVGVLLASCVVSVSEHATHNRTQSAAKSRTNTELCCLQRMSNLTSNGVTVTICTIESLVYPMTTVLGQESNPEPAQASATTMFKKKDTLPCT